VRVILVSGKGGVGKTTLAAATAVAASKRGPTLLVSADAAHSLGDVLGRKLGADPTPVAHHLDGLHLDGRLELERSWGAIADYLRDLLGWSNLDRLRLDELVVVPGLDQLLALSRLCSLVDEGPWEAIVVDCAPSADTLRLLSLPDVLRFYMDRLFGRDGVIGGWARRRFERTLAVPMPGDDVVSSVHELTSELDRLRGLLADATTSARIVVTPERVVVAEAQRTLAYLALYGYPVDAVLVNRVPPLGLGGPDMAPWFESQAAQLDVIDHAFAPLPRLTARLRMAEPVGLDALGELGQELYGELDPLSRLSDRPALEITTAGDESFVRLPANGVDRDDIALERQGDHLIVTLGPHRHQVPLPDRLCGEKVVRAGLADGWVEIVFGGAANAV
jgi:arsenite-transporting ATPase